MPAGSLRFIRPPTPASLAAEAILKARTAQFSHRLPAGRPAQDPCVLADLADTKLIVYLMGPSRRPRRDPDAASRLQRTTSAGGGTRETDVRMEADRLRA